jgi:hypothetical protein
VTDKFHRVTSDRLPEAARRRIVESVMALDRRPDVSDVMVALDQANAHCG